MGRGVAGMDPLNEVAGLGSGGTGEGGGGGDGSVSCGALSVAHSTRSATADERPPMGAAAHAPSRSKAEIRLSLQQVATIPQKATRT